MSSRITNESRKQRLLPCAWWGQEKWAVSNDLEASVEILPLAGTYYAFWLVTSSLRQIQFHRKPGIPMREILEDGVVAKTLRRRAQMNEDYIYVLQVQFSSFTILHVPLILLA
jgi:hypothetical protein